MAFLDLAAANSLWNGYSYYRDGKVVSFAPRDDGTYDGVVGGSGDARYHVHVDETHPRSSSCDCPRAKGRRVVCKHQVALYFTANPSVADGFLDDMERKRLAAEREYEQWRAEEEAAIRRYVNSLPAKEAKEQLANYMIAERFERDDRYW